MSEAPAKRYISTQQAAFIGVAAMVGAGIFSLLGAAGLTSNDHSHITDDHLPHLGTTRTR